MTSLYTSDNILDKLQIDANSIQRESIAMGLILPLVSNSPLHFKMPLVWHIARIRKSLALQQLKIFLDEYGRICGVVFWALVSENCAREILRGTKKTIDDCDMAESGTLWVSDLWAPHGAIRALLKRLRDVELANEPQVTYFRIKGLRRIIKQLSRSDKTYFFVKPRISEEDIGSPYFLKKEGQGLIHSLKSDIEFSKNLTSILELVSRVGEVGLLPLRCALTRVTTPLSLRQYVVIRNHNEEVTGFLSWAWLDIRTVKQQHHVSMHDLAPYQWNEGLCLCVCDAIGLAESAEEILALIATELFPEEDLWIYPRRNAAPNSGLHGFFTSSERKKISASEYVKNESAIDFAALLAA